MRVVITGAAGFIGSHLADTLLNHGAQVTGVDCLTEYYDRDVKLRNLAFLQGRSGWTFVEKRVGAITPAELDDVDTVFHLAAQPGVRSSWREFDRYVELNLLETDRLAKAIVAANVPTVVFASSSSVYGDLSTYPARETDATRPRSPYGVTKLAGEKLWDAYILAQPMRIAALRFFTVYGPGQRPDMATQRLVRAALDGTSFTLYGDGEQRRDFTFVDDIVEACVAVSSSPNLETSKINVLNVGGTGEVSMLELVRTVETAANRTIDIRWAPAQVGDVRRTGADISALTKLTGWEPSTAVEVGVRRQVEFEYEPSMASWRRALT